MKISILIKSLQAIEQEHGDIECECQVQDTTTDENFFVVPEEYEDGWRVNIRTWPY